MSLNSISSGATVKVQFGDLSAAQKEQLMLLLAMEPTDEERQRQETMQSEEDREADDQQQLPTSLQFRSSSSLEISVLWGPLSLADHPACQILNKELQKALYRVPGQPVSRTNAAKMGGHAALRSTVAASATGAALDRSFEASSTSRLHSDVKRSTSTGRRRRSSSRSPSTEGRGNGTTSQGAANSRTPSWSFKLIDEFLAYIVRRGLRSGFRPATNSTATSSAMDLFDEFLVDRCGLPNLIRATCQDLLSASAFFKKICPLCGIFRKYVCQDPDAVEDLKVALEKAGSDAAGLRLNALLLDKLIFFAHLRQTLWPLQVHETQKVAGQFEVDSTWQSSGGPTNVPALLVPRRYVPLKAVPDVVRAELGRYSIGKKVVMQWLQLESEQYLKGTSVAFDVKGHVDLFQLCDAMVTAKFVGTTFSKPSQDIALSTTASHGDSDNFASTLPKFRTGSGGDSGSPTRSQVASAAAVRNPSPQRVPQSPSHVMGKVSSPAGHKPSGGGSIPSSPNSILKPNSYMHSIPSVTKARVAHPSDIAKLLALIPEVVDARKQQRAAATAATVAAKNQSQSQSSYNYGAGDTIDIDPTLLLPSDEGGDFFEAPSAIAGHQGDERDDQSIVGSASVQGRPGSGQTPTSLATVVGPSTGPLARESAGSTVRQQLPRDRPPSSSSAGYSAKYGYSSATASSVRPSSSRAPESGPGSTSASVSTPRTTSGRSRSPSPKPKIIDITTVAPLAQPYHSNPHPTSGRRSGEVGSQPSNTLQSHQVSANPSRRSGSITTESENQDSVALNPTSRSSILFPADSSNTAAERRSFRTLGTNASEEDVLKYSLRRAAKPPPTSPGTNHPSQQVSQSKTSLLVDAESIPYQNHRSSDASIQRSSLLSSRPAVLLSPQPTAKPGAAVVDLSPAVVGQWQDDDRNVAERFASPSAMPDSVLSPARPTGFPEAPLFPSGEPALAPNHSAPLSQPAPLPSVLRSSQARPVRVGPASGQGQARVAVAERAVHFIDDAKDRLLSPSQAHYGLTAREASISSPGLLPSDYPNDHHLLPRNSAAEIPMVSSPPDGHHQHYLRDIDEASESIPAELALEGGLSGRTAQLRFDQPLTTRFSGSTSSEGRQSTGSAVNALQSPPRHSANTAGSSNSGRTSGSLAAYPRSPAVLGEEEEALMRQLEESLKSHRRPIHLDPESAFSTKVLSPPRGSNASRTRLEQLAYAE